MATYTLGANSNFSAISASVNTGDTIALNGYKLTLDVGSPTQSNVTVTAVGNAGTVALGTPTSYTLTGWIFLAGTGPLIASIPAGTTVAGGISATGGSAAGAYGITSLAGTLSGGGTILGGSYSHCIGSVPSTGAITGATIKGSATASAAGINSNSGTLSGVTITGQPGYYGIVTQAGLISGSTINSTGNPGIYGNNGNINTSSIAAGTGNGMHGIYQHSGTLIDCNITGSTGTGSQLGVAIIGGVISNLESGVILDKTGKALGSTVALSKPLLFTIGANLQCAVPTGFYAVYYTGSLSSATFTDSPTKTQISMGSGGSTIVRDAFGSILDTADAFGGAAA